MSVIKLYHGTNAEFQLLDPTKSRHLLDFGTGCYLSDNISQAWGMAKRKFKILGGQKKVLEFEFDSTVLAEACSRVFVDYSTSWTEFVILNRFFPEYQNPYRIIVGPVADGTIPDDIDDYMEQHPGEAWMDEENLAQLTKRLVFDNNRKSVQYCFRDQNVIEKYLKLTNVYYEQ